VIVTNSNIWKQGDDIITYVFQTPKDNLMHCSHDDLWPYLEDFHDYSFEHSDIFYEEDFQPLLCSVFYKGEDMVCLKKDTCDEVFYPPSFLLSHHVTKDAFGKHVPWLNFSPGKIFFL
jgi:hypothetical protein